MALSSQKVTVIRVDYEAGILTKSDIAKKHNINRQTLYKQADKHKWLFGKNKQAIDKITEQKSLEHLLNNRIDLSTQITEQFLEDINHHRQLLMKTSSELEEAYKEAANNKTKVELDEYSRIFAGAKITKIQMEALNIGYSGARKALGMSDTKLEHTGQVDKEITFKVVHVNGNRITS
jgi:hypothetical protein